ncbi:lysozyme [Qipengyuania sp.]|uniref:lysozyme n=1 Tax=Qipengyuania sp. TaxID=2004515 RepID=UPI0035C7C3CD
MSRRAVFAIFRRLVGRGLRQREVNAIDGALDQAGVPRDSRVAQTAGPACIDLIRSFEGCARKRRDSRYEAYPDPGTGGAPWTIGWGATGPGIGPGTIWTQEMCDTRLDRDVARHAAEVSEALGDAPTTQHQFDALVSFHYNTGAIARATLTRKHRAGDHAAATAEFARWNRSGGRVLKGLVRRREAEAALYDA